MKSSLWLMLLVLLGVARADDTVVEVIPLSNRPAAELQPLLTPLLEETDRLIDNGSSLIVKTTPARLENIRTLVKKLDVRLSNLIVTVFQNSYKTAAELNAEAAVNVSPSGIQMHGMNADTRDVNNSRNMQTVRTMDGQPAHIQTGKVKLIQNITAYGSINTNPGVNNTTGVTNNPITNSNAGTTNNPITTNPITTNPIVGTNTQMIEASTGFAVIPRLSGQQVIIDVEPWSERFQNNGNIETQGARTTLRANLGEWVEIAGNDNTGNNQSNSGFNTFNHTTVQNNLRILIKVDKAD